MALEVHVWSDVVCPWCYIGKKRFESALEKFGEPVELTWHSFELDPSRTRSSGPKLSEAEYLAKKYGMSVERAKEMMAQMQATGRAAGIEFRAEGGTTSNSFDAHRVLHLARTLGKQDEMKERLFRAQWIEGIDLADPAKLVAVASEVLSDVDRVSSVVHSAEFSEEVRGDEEAARELGIRGVPFFVIGRYGISGAQSTEVFLQALDRANVDEPREETAEGAVCEPGEC